MKVGVPAAGVHPHPPAGAKSSVTTTTDRRFADFVMLTKPRLNLLVLLTTLAGLYLASPTGVELTLLLNTLVGTALVAGWFLLYPRPRQQVTDPRMQPTNAR